MEFTHLGGNTYKVTLIIQVIHSGRTLGNKIHIKCLYYIGMKWQMFAFPIERQIERTVYSRDKFNAYLLRVDLNLSLS